MPILIDAYSLHKYCVSLILKLVPPTNHTASKNTQKGQKNIATFVTLARSPDCIHSLKLVAGRGLSVKQAAAGEALEAALPPPPALPALRPTLEREHKILRFPGPISGKCSVVQQYLVTGPSRYSAELQRSVVHRQYLHRGISHFCRSKFLC